MSVHGAQGPDRHDPSIAFAHITARHTCTFEREALPRSDTEKPLKPIGSVELLAPAGSPESLYAAVANGADAVYLGAGDLNARRGAANFDIETLHEPVRFAHLHGVKVYLTANVVILPSEVSSALDLIDAAWAAGVDAVIVQDLGLLRVLRQVMPEVRVHGSTQIGTMNPYAVRALGRMGARRVTLARELSLEAIAACAATDIEVEVFVHGALCYAYSGQCLMSSMIGRRSANRGLCAQPCRLQYSLIDPQGAKAYTPGRHLLSTKDLAGISQLPRLIEAGVSALKIEGRIKSPEYVAIVTSVYRAALDRALRAPAAYEVLPSELERLEEAFNRGFTDAYLVGGRGGDLMSYTRPNNRGVPIGRVVDSSKRGALVELSRSLDAADTIQFWTRSGHFTQQAGDMRLDGGRVTSAPAGVSALLQPQQPVQAQDRVFRVANAALLSAARRTFSSYARGQRDSTPVDIKVRVRVGRPLAISVAAEGFEAHAQGRVVEPARSKALTAEEVVVHVGRLGGSGYEASSWDIDLDAGAGVPFSELHRVRREALDRLDEQRLMRWAGRSRRFPKPPSISVRSEERQHAEPMVVATAWDPAVASACLEAGADQAWLRVFPGSRSQALPRGVRPLLPKVVWPAEAQSVLQYAENGPVMAGELGTLAEASRMCETHADWSLNAVNAYAVDELASVGASFVWLSPELSGRQIAEVASASAVPVGCLAWGRVELMVAEQCVLMAAGRCARRCASCPRRKGWWRLRDRKGYEFPVTTDPTGRSHVMNSIVLDLSTALDEIVASGVQAVRLDFSDEEADRAAEVVRFFKNGVAEAFRCKRSPEDGISKPKTSGHFYRGVR